MGKSRRNKSTGTEDKASRLRRSTLHVKYSRQFPFKNISRKPSGKSLLQAQRYWRDGTAMIDRLGLPQTFDIEEVDKLVSGAGLREKSDILELCGRAILMEQKAVDPDITDLVILNALCSTGEKCELYLADVVYAFCNQFFYLNSFYKSKKKTVSIVQAALKKAMGKSADPRVVAMQAMFLMIFESPRAIDQEDPFEGTIKSLKICIESFEHRTRNFQAEWEEGSTKLSVYYTLATVLNRKLSIMTSSRKHLKKLSPEILSQLLQEYRVCLELFLKKAPDCHWDVPSACFMLSTEWVRRKTPPTGAKVKELLKRNEEDVKRSIELFERGVRSVEWLVKWNPEERVEEKEEFKQAKQLQELLMKEGFREKEIESLPKTKVEMHVLVDEENLSWSEWVRWNLTETRNVQFLYLIVLIGILLDPIFNVFGFFLKN